ncbi:MAG: HDOD domain-containing protein [Pirellulales bacterium]|nr:HDOD domain-containing protein [Pirellulales bacterium]
MPLLQPGIEAQRPSLAEIVQQIDEISTLPHIALRVMEVANDPNTGAADLKEAMESDAAFSARVLRCVNSSAYAVRSKITNLQQAIAYLGLKQIRNLAMTISVSELFQKNGTIGPYQRSALWRHLVSVGICARMIAMRLQFMDFEDVFLAGLLHDVGIILEDQHVHEGFCNVIGALKGDRTLAAVEREQLGFDHTELGEKVAELWGFPEGVRASIRRHHMSVSYKGEHLTTVRCVEVANLLCTLKGISSVGMKLVRFSGPAIAGLSLTRDDVAILAEDLDDELAANAGLFQA